MPARLAVEAAAVTVGRAGGHGGFRRGQVREALTVQDLRLGVAQKASVLLSVRGVSVWARMCRTLSYASARRERLSVDRTMAMKRVPSSAVGPAGCRAP